MSCLLGNLIFDRDILSIFTHIILNDFFSNNSLKFALLFIISISLNMFCSRSFVHCNLLLWLFDANHWFVESVNRQWALYIFPRYLSPILPTHWMFLHSFWVFFLFARNSTVTLTVKLSYLFTFAFMMLCCASFHCTFQKLRYFHLYFISKFSTLKIPLWFFCIIIILFATELSFRKNWMHYSKDREKRTCFNLNNEIYSFFSICIIKCCILVTFKEKRNGSRQ